MKKSVFLPILSLSLLLPGVVSAVGWTGNLNGFIGGKALDDEDWFADEQAEVGVRLDFRRDDWPFSIAVDTHFSEGDFKGYVFFPLSGTRYYEEDVDTCEFNLGIRKYWDAAANMRPFLGGGLAYAQLEAKGKLDGVTELSDKGNGVGIWLNGGILWTIDAFNIGFDVRYTRVEVGLDAGDFEGGGGHAGVLLGYHW